MSSANISMANSISPHLTPRPTLSISTMRLLIKRLNRVGESRQPCLTPEVTGKGSEIEPFTLTRYSV